MKSLWLKAFPLFLICLTLVGCPQKTPSTNVFQSADSTPILLPVKVSGKWGYVNGNGQLVINPQFDNADEFEEGRARICLGKSCDMYTFDSDSLWGFIDTSGKVIVTPQCQSESRFSEGVASVCTGDCSSNPKTPHSWGYIDREGKVVIPMQFGLTWIFRESLAGVCVGDCLDATGKWGFIDHSGRFVINPQYDDIRDFKNGFAQVT